MIKFWIDFDKARKEIYDMIEAYKQKNPVFSPFDNTWNTAYELGASSAVSALFNLFNDKSAVKIEYRIKERNRSNEDDR